MKKHGPAPIEDQWCPVCETTRLPCPASEGRWVIIEMRMLFLGVRHKQVICHVCRQRWYVPRAVEKSLTYMLLDPRWKTAHRRAQQKEKAKEALDVIARMLADRMLEDMEKETIGNCDTETDENSR